MRCILAAILTGTLPWMGYSQHTFSIVAVDPVSGEIGSAGATCGDSIIWPGTPGAYIISDVIPGVGAIHTQAYYLTANQLNAHRRMIVGESPQAIINWLRTNDIQSNASIRQYGIVDYNGGQPRAAAYTGVNCSDYKNHIVGDHYAIQGNILLGHHILEAMEFNFNTTEGCLSGKLMAALQGANLRGADTRCYAEGTSSLSAFLRVAKPTDDPGSLFIDFNIAGTPRGVEPIDELQKKYDQWARANSDQCSPVVSTAPVSQKSPDLLIYPNPTQDRLNIQLFNTEVTRMVLTDRVGKKVMDQSLTPAKTVQLSLPSFPAGIYILTLFANDQIIAYQKIVLN